MIKSGQLEALPNTPGVYLFKRGGGLPAGRQVLYIGKATSLRSRVRSYLGDDLAEKRSEWIAKMIQLVTRVEARPTASVLEALILEAALIKKYQPPYNAKDKSDKSFNYLTITREEYPKVLITRGAGNYGPFPKSSELRVALKMVRKIFPFRDKCLPRAESRGQPKPCFNYQIGLCPGVCVGAISSADYRRNIKHLKLFFSGRQKQLLRTLKREMKTLAQEQRFEQAGERKRQIFALQHIQDVALITTPATLGVARRIEAYDVAHLAGQNAVGVMVVLEDGEPAPNQYRKFKLRTAQLGDDIGALREILERRFNHPEWPFPELVVVDGGKTQLNCARTVLAQNGLANIPVVSVVKDEKHRPREILPSRGNVESLALNNEKAIIHANHEAHRFAISYHRQKRRKAMYKYVLDYFAN